jgi:hypothetical protein
MCHHRAGRHRVIDEVAPSNLGRQETQFVSVTSYIFVIPGIRMSSFLIKTSALRRFAEIGCQVAIAKLIIVTSADVTGTDIAAVRILRCAPFKGEVANVVDDKLISGQVQKSARRKWQPRFPFCDLLLVRGRQ